MICANCEGEFGEGFHCQHCDGAEVIYANGDIGLLLFDDYEEYED